MISVEYMPLLDKANSWILCYYITSYGLDEGDIFL